MSHEISRLVVVFIEPSSKEFELCRLILCLLNSSNLLQSKLTLPATRKISTEPIYAARMVLSNQLWNMIFNPHNVVVLNDLVSRLCARSRNDAIVSCSPTFLMKKPRTYQGLGIANITP